MSPAESGAAASQKRWQLLRRDALIPLWLLALWVRSGPLWLLVLILTVLSLATWLWDRYGASRVHIERAFRPGRCFAGEPVSLEWTVTNAKALPLPYLGVTEEIPDGLTMPGQQLAPTLAGRSDLQQVFTLPWYARIRRQYTVVPVRRGLYRLGGATATLSDPFGLVERHWPVPARPELLVYPPVLPLPDIGLPAERPFGDLAAANRLFPDPMRVAGVREYRAGDPLNRIHWRATARTGRLQVRVLESSAQGGLAIFLNTWGFAHRFAGYEPQALERAVLAAAAAAGWATERGYPCGLYANGAPVGWGTSLRLPPTQGPEVLTRILEGLARLTPHSDGPLSQLLTDEVPGLPYGTAILVVSRMLPPDLWAAIARARSRGHPVTVLLTGDEVGTEPSPPPGVRIYTYREEVAPDA